MAVVSIGNMNTNRDTEGSVVEYLSLTMAVVSIGNMISL